MSIDFGWWNKDPEKGKYQVVADIHGGNIVWTRKQGHHQPWGTHKPSEDDWEKLVKEAEKRLPRRLLSPKQFQAIVKIKDMRVCEE